MTRIIAITAAVAMFSLPGSTSASAKPPPPVAVGEGSGLQPGPKTVLAKVTTSGSDGSKTKAGSHGDGIPNTDATIDPCWYVPIKADAADPLLHGAAPSSGVMYQAFCPDPVNLTIHGLVFPQVHKVWVPDGQPVIAPPPDPGQLAQQAAGTLTAPDPVVHFGPDDAKLAVKVPVWLWIDDPAPMTLTVAVRGLSVTVTATLVSTTWSMGEPVDPANPADKVAPFTCQGAGTPAPAHPDPKITPPCGYTYIWKSLASRTNGTGTWPVTATTNWNVTWTASDGTTGALPAPLTPTTTQQVVIGEWHASLVAGPGG